MFFTINVLMVSMSIYFKEAATLNHHTYFGRIINSEDTSFIFKAVVWVPAMVGNTFDAIAKTLLLAFHLFVSIGATLLTICSYALYPCLADKEIPTLKHFTTDAWKLTADTFFTIAADCAGIFCPYLAYKIDAYVFDNYTSKNFKDLDNPYPIF